MKRLIKVTFMLKAKHPASLKDMEYFSFAESNEEAQKKAEIKFDVDLAGMALNFRTEEGDISRHYKRVIFQDIDLV
tara:strand:+ start:1815 stop:2042 length:228 start_codon:yes stop_codon:yes gene_type:complete